MLGEAILEITRSGFAVRSLTFAIEFCMDKQDGLRWGFTLAEGRKPAACVIPHINPIDA